MILKLLPQISSDVLILEKSGKNTLKVNGELFEFSKIEEGDILPMDAINSDSWFVGDVTRKDGNLIITLRMPIGMYPTEAQSFPPILNIKEDGVIKLPE